MATKLRHSLDFSCPPAQFAAAITSEQYWRDLVANVAADVSELESFTATDDEVRVVLQQRVPEKNLPSVITKIRKGDLEIARTVVWSVDGDEVTNGTFSAVVTGAPAKVNGTQTLVSTATGAQVIFDGSVEVSIPFVGGKIEKQIAKEVQALIDAERDYTVNWIGQQ
ncbi:DUF2505 domain-containing protein [Williamsia sp. 1135]|uniref:DUF2505 domain-containing protein n=1 Tax=Williamsia sp. 1135 TaxID=1889262 RepID=UPI000A0F58FF|nr:DUF2505 domain-containing protein [Williamsia sp. 1135]ORM34396.1 hypothetical protein BFL43_11775 [Williamsia sp. 1135]